jgi:hypothetical protein
MPLPGATRNPITDEAQVLDSEPGGFLFAAWRNFNIFVWNRGTTMDAVTRINRTNPERTAAHPEKLSTVHIITASAGPPEPEARNALEAMHTEWGHTVGCAAVIIERGGLMGVAVRSVIAGMTIVAPKHYRVKVFDSIDASAPWLAEHHGRSTGVQCDEADVLAVMQAARKAAV